LAARKAQGGIIATSGAFVQDVSRFAAGKPIDRVDARRLGALIRTVRIPPATAGPLANLTRFTPPTARGVATTPPPSPKGATTCPAEPAARKACPRCGAKMVHRTARRKPPIPLVRLGLGRRPAISGFDCPKRHEQDRARAVGLRLASAYPARSAVVATPGWALEDFTLACGYGWGVLRGDAESVRSRRSQKTARELLRLFGQKVPQSE
jgi:hypothetical protein